MQGMMTSTVGQAWQEGRGSKDVLGEEAGHAAGHGT